MVTSSYPKFRGDVTAPFIESIALGAVARGHAVDMVLPFHPDLRREADDPVRFFPYKYAPTRGLNIWGYAQSLEADVKLKKSVYLLAPVVARALRKRGRRATAAQNATTWCTTTGSSRTPGSSPTWSKRAACRRS